MILEDRRDVDRDIQETLGLVPTFFKQVPDYLLSSEWASFKSHGRVRAMSTARFSMLSATQVNHPARAAPPAAPRVAHHRAARNWPRSRSRRRRVRCLAALIASRRTTALRPKLLAAGPASTDSTPFVLKDHEPA